jgi:hypothetical protein
MLEAVLTGVNRNLRKHARFSSQMPPAMASLTRRQFAAGEGGITQTQEPDDLMLTESKSGINYKVSGI